MRSDMAKVIVERPRHGSRARGMGKGYRRQLQRCGHDAPKRERIKQRPTKEFNEHLGPLRRYLASQVGRPWDKIYSELCKLIGRDTVVNNHVFTHLFDYVAVPVIEVGGVLCKGNGYGVGFPLQGSHRLFYVCPHTGILKRIPQKSRRQRRQDYLPTPMKYLAIDYGLTFVCQGGVWMRVRLADYPKQRKRDALGIIMPVCDLLHREGISRSEAAQCYGRPALAVELRRAAPEEVRKYCEPLKAPNRV